jgi:protein TonB
MLARYVSSLGAGSFVTLALLYWMQHLIVSEPTVWVAKRPPFSSSRLHEVREPPFEPRPPRDRPVPPDPPPTPPALADSVTIIDKPTPLSAGIEIPTGRHFGDPRPPFGSGTGPGVTDHELTPIARVQPVYPYAAARRELEGRVVVEFTVTARGTVRDPRVVTSSDAVFERAALAAALRFRYRPQVVDGNPVAVPGVRAEFEFRLHD